MIPIILFWCGVAVTIITGLKSWQGGAETKRGAVAFPFALLFAAVVARYLGM
jgi:hypothetical protein